MENLLSNNNNLSIKILIIFIAKYDTIIVKYENVLLIKTIEEMSRKTSFTAIWGDTYSNVFNKKNLSV